MIGRRTAKFFINTKILLAAQPILYAKRSDLQNLAGKTVKWQFCPGKSAAEANKQQAEL